MTEHTPDPGYLTPEGAAPSGPVPSGGYPPAGYGYGPLPMTPSQERTWAVVAHLSPFLASVVALPVLGPLVVYLMYRDRGPFVRRHAAAALNFQLMLLLLGVAGLVLGGLLTLVTFGLGLIVLIPLALLVAVGAVVVQVLAAVAANQGREYSYPLTPPFVS